jgi:hypothetical protein
MVTVTDRRRAAGLRLSVQVMLKPGDRHRLRRRRSPGVTVAPGPWQLAAAAWHVTRTLALACRRRRRTVTVAARLVTTVTAAGHWKPSRWRLTRPFTGKFKSLIQLRTASHRHGGRCRVPGSQSPRPRLSVMGLWPGEAGRTDRDLS